MARRWDDSHLPGAIAAFVILSASVWPWFYWWPQAGREGFDRFVGHMTWLIWPTCGAIMAAGMLADAMANTHFNGKPNPRNERLGNLCRAIGLLIGSGVHFSQYSLNGWVMGGWAVSGAIGFGLGYAAESGRTDGKSSG